MSENWSNKEVDLIIADYFLMLKGELDGNPYNKSSHRASLIPLLNNRPNGSVERKHQNISAILTSIGLPYIKGYKPLGNFQNLLKERVFDYLSSQREILEPRFLRFSDAEVIQNVTYNFSNILELAPKKEKVSEPITECARKPFKINYLEREQNNSSLGEKGERFVMEFEKWNLIAAGKDSLAEKIEWVSKFDDSFGFDILSKNINGSDKFIEVKTTKLGKDAPIFFSKRELEVSKEKGREYNLYRVFNFSENPKMFQLNGSFDSFCSTEAIHFKGIF